MPTEIADAQASLTRAEQNLPNARYNYLIAMDRLQYAMGLGEAPVTVAHAHHSRDGYDNRSGIHEHKRSSAECGASRSR
jgi:hypothetical protein